MSGAPTSILCALWAAAMLTPLVRAGEDPMLTGGAVANGPVALPSAADPERRRPAPGEGAALASGDAAHDAAPGDDAAVEPAASGPSSAGFSVPRAVGLESAPLGRPRGARPSGAAAAGGPEGEGRRPGVWSDLDPRVLELARVTGALAVVLGLVLLSRALLRRGAGVLGRADGPAGVVEVLARYPVGRRQTILLLKVARRVLVVHHAGAAMRTLSEMTGPDDVADLLARLEGGSRLLRGARFSAKLRQFEGEHDRIQVEGMLRRGETADEIEVVDLTRRSPRGLAALFGRQRSLP